MTRPEVRIHFGHFRQGIVRMAVADPPPNTIEVIKTEEKGSDVNLATYLLRDAFRQECELQLVITNDSDLAQPIRIVRKELRMPVGVANPHRPRKRTRLLQGDFYRQIRPVMFETCQLPVSLKDGGGAFGKPSDW